MSKDPELKQATPEHVAHVRHDAEFFCQMLGGFPIEHRMDVFIFTATDLFLNVKPKPPLSRLDAYDKYAAMIRENIRLNIEQEAKR
jgi:hypothetical protein